MVEMDRTVRLIAGLAFLLAAAALFAGLLSLGSETTTLAVGIVDLLVGLALVGSGLRLGRRERAAESR
jgi:hypothetical protein